jgi:Radical SAM superfamily/Iron-sulfur cluster-binding domain
VYINNITMNYNLESFCPEPWSQLEIDAQGDYKICCLANYDKDFGMALDDDGNVMNVMTHSFEEAMNSKTHRDHRLQLSRNEKPRRCRTCYDSEEATKGNTYKQGQSKRQFVLSFFKDNPSYVDVNAASIVTSETGHIEPKISNLDIRFGNLCNYKCVMCSPQHSNLWYEDWLEISNTGPELHNRTPGAYKKGEYKTYPIVRDEQGRLKMQGLDPWWETDTWWNRFEKVAPNLQHIYFTGGEPLLVPQMQECLDRLISNGYAKNIVLRYDTNLSVINKKVIEKWKHFKHIRLSVSLDDVGDRYNLIRNPGDFNRFESNVQFLLQNGIPITYFSSCVGIFSIYSMTRCIDFALKYKTSSFFRFLEHPTWLDMRWLPRDAKLEIISNLENRNDGPIHKSWYKSQISLLKKYLNEENPEAIREFIRVMSILDKNRGTDWKNTIPDVADLINRYYL